MPNYCLLLTAFLSIQALCAPVPPLYKLASWYDAAPQISVPDSLLHGQPCFGPYDAPVRCIVFYGSKSHCNAEWLGCWSRLTAEYPNQIRLVHVAGHWRTGCLLNGRLLEHGLAYWALKALVEYELVCRAFPQSPQEWARSAAAIRSPGRR